MRKNVYIVQAGSGISFLIEADSYQEARMRASDPGIAREVSRMMVNAISDIRNVEPLRGPARGKLHFADEFFG